MDKFVKLIIMLSSGLFGCVTETVPAPPIVGVISADLSDSCVQTILEADSWILNKINLSDRLKSIMDYKIKPTVSDTDFVFKQISFVPFTDPKFAGFTEWLHYKGSKKPTAAIIKINSCTLNTVIHEMGHAFGLPHTDKVGFIMNPYTNTAGFLISNEEKEILKNVILSIQQKKNFDIDTDTDIVANCLR